ADGTWHPSRACKSFSLAPSSTGRSWKTGCAETGMSGPEETCGKPFVDPGALSDGGDATGDGGSPGDPSTGSGAGHGGFPHPRANGGTPPDHHAQPDGLGCAARLSARPPAPAALPFLALAWAAITLRRRRST